MRDTRTIDAALRRAAEWYPEREAFVQGLEDGGQRLTYSAVNGRARRFANALAERGVGSGDRVAFLSRSTVDHTTAYLAVAKLGAIGSPIHAREAPAAIKSLLERIEPAVLVYHPDYAETVAWLRNRVDSITTHIALDRADPEPVVGESYTAVLEDATDEEPDTDVAPNDVAYINFTSGSTGPAKPIPHTHEEVVASSQLTQYGWHIRPSDVFLNARSPSFIGWSIWQFTLVNTAATTVFLEAWDASDVASVIDAESVTKLALTPTQWNMVLQSATGEEALDSVELAVYAGETMGPALLSDLRDRVTENVSTAYGSTEVMQSGTALTADEFSEATMESIGKPLPNVDARVIDPESRDPDAVVPRGEVGELITRGPSVADEVWDDPAATRRTFHEDGWWFSGDLARRGDDGNVYLEGRADNMIISGGINIHAENIEHALEAHPAVREVAVVGVPHDTWTEAVKAYVVPGDDDLTAAALDQWWRDNEELADYRRPRSYEFVDTLPRTHTGKLDRAALRGNE